MTVCWTSWTFKTGPTRRPEMLLKIQRVLQHQPEEQSSQGCEFCGNFTSTVFSSCHRVYVSFIHFLNGIFKIKEKHQYTVNVHVTRRSRALYVLNPKVTPYFRFLWPCVLNIRWRERTNKMQLIWCLLLDFLSQHVSRHVTPIIGRIRPCPSACGTLPGCVGCGWLRSCGAASWAVWKFLFEQ